jgi:hypothetical protein
VTYDVGEELVIDGKRIAQKQMCPSYQFITSITWTSHARQVKGDDPDKKGCPVPPGWGLGMGLTTTHSKKLIVTKVEQRNKLDRFNDDGRKRTRYIFW